VSDRLPTAAEVARWLTALREAGHAVYFWRDLDWTSGRFRERAAEASDASVGGFTTSGAIVITRWPSSDSVTPATVHIFPSRTSVSPASGTRSVITYSQAPDGKRMVMGSGATNNGVRGA